jgi:hypothetical protein
MFKKLLASLVVMGLMASPALAATKKVEKPKVEKKVVKKAPVKKAVAKKAPVKKAVKK